MRFEIKRGYHDFQDNENWLNEMSSIGNALTGYKVGWHEDRFIFESASPGEYRYRILVLDKVASHPESVRYLQFLEESGIELVTSYHATVFLRKKAADGPFDIYTDKNSLIRYYRGMARRYLIGLAIVPVFLAVLISIVAIFTSGGIRIGLILGIAVGSLFSISIDITFFRFIRHYTQMAKQLERERSIHE